MRLLPIYKRCIAPMGIALLLLHLAGSAQTPVFKNYSVENGLPSSEVYFSIQDTKGYIWVSTDRGVARFDGFEFELFTTDNGLPDNVVFKMFEDAKGRVWFAPFSLQLSYYQDGEIHRYPYNNVIHETLGEAIIHSFHVDTLDNVSIGTNGMGFLKVDPSGTPFWEKPGNVNGIFIELKTIENSMVGSILVQHVMTENKQKPVQSPDVQFILKADINGQLDSALIQAPEGEFAPKTNLIHHMNPLTGKIYLGISGVLYEYIPASKQIKKLWSPKTSVHWIYSNPQWLLLGTANKGIYVFDNTKPIRQPAYQFLNGKSVSSIAQDNKGGYWVTSLEHGLFYAANIDNLAYTVNDGLSAAFVSAIGGNLQGDLLVGHRNSNLDLISNGKYQKTFKLSGSRFTEITEVKYDSLYDYNIIAGPGIFTYQNNQLQSIQPSVAPIDAEYLGDDKWLICRSNLLTLYRDSITYLSKKANSPNCRCIHILGKDSVLVGSLKGLYLFANGAFSFLGEESPLLSYRVTDIKTHKKGYVLATRGAGVVFVSPTDTFNITTRHGLAGNQLNNLFIDGDQNIWATTNKGVSMISADDPYAIYTLNTQQGLLSNEITSVYVDDRFAWIGTKKGMNRIPKKEVEDMAAPLEVKIKSMHVNSQLVVNNGGATIKMAYDKSFLQLQLMTFDFRSAGQPVYRYRFKELGKDWIEIASNKIQIPSIPHGIHTLQLMAKNEDGIWSTEPTEVVFEVTPPFWLTWWFYILSLVVIAAVISAYNYIQMQRVRERSRLKNQIRNYQQQAFSAQMNPHFIFNSLNSIQNFIAQNDAIQSNRYLAKFAKLMRIVLANSREPKIPLADDLTALNLYLELETIRFNKALSHSLVVAPEIDQDKALIPPLLIQPFVENAIWHGIMHRENGGELSISLALSEKDLICKIEDNGIGRKSATAMNTDRSHESFSTSAAKDRFKLLSEEYGKEYAFLIEDLKDQDGIGRGTVVSFKLPYELKKS